MLNLMSVINKEFIRAAKNHPHWRDAIKMARVHQENLFLFHGGLGHDPDAAFKALASSLWERREQSGWLRLPPDEPIFLGDPNAARLVQTVNWTELGREVAGRIVEILNGSKQEPMFWHDEVPRLLANPPMHPPTHDLVEVDPDQGEFGNVVDIVLLQKDGDFISIEGGVLQLETGESDQVICKGANGRKALEFFMGAFLVVRSVDGVIHADFAPRCAGEGDIVANIFASKEAVEDYLRSRQDLAIDVDLVEITPEVVEEFGTTYRSNHLL